MGLIRSSDRPADETFTNCSGLQALCKNWQLAGTTLRGNTSSNPARCFSGAGFHVNRVFSLNTLYHLHKIAMVATLSQLLIRRRCLIQTLL